MQISTVGCIVYVNIVPFTGRCTFLFLRESSQQAIVLSEGCVSFWGITASRVELTFAGPTALLQLISKAIIKQTLLSHNSRPKLRQANLLLLALSSHLWPIVKESLDIGEGLILWFRTA